jgi:hypothetical protein
VSGNVKLGGNMKEYTTAEMVEEAFKGGEFECCTAPLSIAPLMGLSVKCNGGALYWNNDIDFNPSKVNITQTIWNAKWRKIEPQVDWSKVPVDTKVICTDFAGTIFKGYFA